MQYVAEGEAPEDIRQVFQQRSRWTKGHYQVRVCVHARVCVCVCVCERERDRDERSSLTKGHSQVHVHLRLLAP
jgi:cellulose synthase/poly-beta-1,6-N-acetylglucosamine synthase-like glycosyltransferase